MLYRPRKLQQRRRKRKQQLHDMPPELHFDIAAATQQQRDRKIEDTITHYIMCSNFKSHHHLLIDSGESTHVCPKNYAPNLPLRPCGELSSTATLHGYQQEEDSCLRHQVCSLQAGKLQDHDCEVSYPQGIDRGYGPDFNPRHCTITHGSQQAHLIRDSGPSTYEQRRSTSLQNWTSTQ